MIVIQLEIFLFCLYNSFMETPLSLSTNSQPIQNITISGLPGSGSTTLLKELKQVLQFHGWRGFSGGEFMRSYAEEHGLLDPATGKLHHDATVYGEDFDREVDYGMRHRLESEQGWILESWLSGFLAQQIPGVMKILLICSDDAVRIDRIVNRDEVSVEEAKHHLLDRANKNIAKWSRMYASEWQQWVVDAGKATAQEEIDFYKPELYDIVVDTFSMNKQKTFELVLDTLYASRPDLKPATSTTSSEA